MKRMIAICAAALCLTMALAPAVMAADPAATQPEVCYPSAITRSEDGTELRKLYDLGPEDDPAGIPRSDFERDGFHYTLTDLLHQELPEYEERAHTETVTLEDIANAAHISRSEAGRCFNTYMGCSPVDALIQYRLQIARRLLNEKTKTLQEISYACGFNSVNYFSRKFKEIYGFTPSQASGLGK